MNGEGLALVLFGQTMKAKVNAIVRHGRLMLPLREVCARRRRRPVLCEASFAMRVYAGPSRWYQSGPTLVALSRSRVRGLCCAGHAAWIASTMPSRPTARTAPADHVCPNTFSAAIFRSAKKIGSTCSLMSALTSRNFACSDWEEGALRSWRVAPIAFDAMNVSRARTLESIRGKLRIAHGMRDVLVIRGG
jgi:hypothetical protein